MMAVWETDPEVIDQSPQSSQFAQIWQRASKHVYSCPLAAVRTSRTQLHSRFDMLVCPAVLDSGLRFLPEHRLGLELRHEQRFDNGIVQLRYDVSRTG